VNAGEVIQKRVRYMLKDEEVAGAPAVWPNAFLWVLLEDGMRELKKRRADLFSKADATVFDVASVISNDTDILLDESCAALLSHYVCWKALLRDSGDPEHARQAKAHRDAYEAGVLTA